MTYERTLIFFTYYWDNVQAMVKWFTLFENFGTFMHQDNDGTVTSFWIIVHDEDAKGFPPY